MQFPKFGRDAIGKEELFKIFVKCARIYNFKSYPLKFNFEFQGPANEEDSAVIDITVFQKDNNNTTINIYSFYSAERAQQIYEIIKSSRKMKSVEEVKHAISEVRGF